MIVVMKHKTTSMIAEFEDVVNFWFDTTKFYLKFRNDKRMVIWRRYYSLDQIKE